MKKNIPKISEKKPKNPEIIRLCQFLSVMNMEVVDLARETGVSDRTITNCIWGNNQLGAQLLRKLLGVYNVSLDWLLAGEGEMFLSTASNDKKIVLDVNESPQVYESFGDDHKDEQNDENENTESIDPLIHWLPNIDASQLQDFWYLTATIAEKSLIQAGATPGKDYTLLNLYELAQPIVIYKLKTDNLKLEVFE